jgi:hypothetical protein
MDSVFQQNPHKKSTEFRIEKSMGASKGLFTVREIIPIKPSPNHGFYSLVLTSSPVPSR